MPATSKSSIFTARPEQKEKYLGPLVQGKIRSCFSMTEVEMPGSNPVMMDTTALKDKDDYVINGQTKEERFRSLIVVAHTLEAEANKTGEQSGL